MFADAIVLRPCIRRRDHIKTRSSQAKDVVALVASVAQNHSILSLWVSADFTPYVGCCLCHELLPHDNMPKKQRASTTSACNNHGADPTSIRREGEPRSGVHAQWAQRSPALRARRQEDTEAGKWYWDPVRSKQTTPPAIGAPPHAMRAGSGCRQCPIHPRH